MIVLLRHRRENQQLKSLLCVLSRWRQPYAVPFSSQVRLTHGLQAPGVLDLLYADDSGRLHLLGHIFILRGEAQLHDWLTPSSSFSLGVIVPEQGLLATSC